MATTRYTVSSSALVTGHFRGLIAVARQRGMLAEFVRAGDWIVSELERTPLEFGESRDYLPHLQLRPRVAFVDPLTVWFAVHEAQPLVFIRGFRLCVPGAGRRNS